MMQCSVTSSLRWACGAQSDGPCGFDPGSEKSDMFFAELVEATEGGYDLMAAMAAATDADSVEEEEEEEEDG
jgi:hypothetical protein